MRLGQQAVNVGAAQIAAGVHDVVIGGGVEHMGRVPIGVGFKWADEVGTPFPPELLERYELVPQGISAEMIAERWEISRSEMDELRCAPTSSPPARRRRGASSARSSRSRSTATRPSPTRASARTRASRPSRLKPAFKPDGRVTAGNASQISDGAAPCC